MAPTLAAANKRRWRRSAARSVVMWQRAGLPRARCAAPVLVRLAALAPLLLLVLSGDSHARSADGPHARLKHAGVAPARLNRAPTVAASTTIATLELPPAGSYTLDRIMAAPNGQVADSDGSLHPLADFTTGKVTLLSLIYTACSDSSGCPLALATMHTLKAAIEQDRRLREQVRLVSLSFDPAHDTVPVMRSYGGADALVSARPRWFFLTTTSTGALAPLLAGFGQDVRDARVEDAAGAGVRPQLSHLLKLYLLDPGGTVREIYSPSFLQPAAMLADIRTLVAQSGGASR